MTEIRLTAEGRARLRAIAEQATSGPWVIQGVQSDYEIIGAITESQNEGSVGTRVLTLSSQVPMPAPDDVAHIAAFHPETALALLNHVDALERENDEARETLAKVEADNACIRVENAKAFDTISDIASQRDEAEAALAQMREENERLRAVLDAIASPGTIEDFGNGWAVGLARKVLS